MKKITYLSLIGLYNAVFLIAAIYGIAYSLESEGFNNKEAMLFFFLPGILALLVPFFATAGILIAKRKEMDASELKISWVDKICYISLLTLVFTLGLDYLITLIDPNIAYTIGLSMDELLTESDPLALEGDSFTRYPLFLQGIVFNAVLVVMGVLAGTLMAGGVKPKQRVATGSIYA